MLNKLIKYLSSLRFTILLICLLAMIFAVGLWIPQQRLLKTIYLQWQKNAPGLVAFLDALGLTTIYTSPITITLWLLFFLNLSLVLWQRWPIIKSRITLSDAKIADPVTVGGYPFRSSYPLPGDLDSEKIIGLLRKNRYTILGDASGFYGVKNRMAPVAFMLFHLSFFLILLGGVVSVYTEFVGYLDLAQGESFQGELSRYNASPQPKMPEIGSPPSASFTVKSIVPRVVHNTPTGISVLLVDSQGQKHDVDINRPYSTEHTSFVFKHLGVSPLFVLKDASGKETGGAYIKLDVLQRKPDRFVLGPFSYTATFYPDYVLEGGKRATRSMEFNNPVFFIAVEQAGKKIAEGLVPKNGALEFAGYRLEMRDMPFWVRFYVVKQRGLSILYAGFAIATIGVIWRLLFYRREIVGAVREQDGARCLVVAGRSEYYKSLAEDEFTKLFKDISGNG
ncbi:cytochrome c biogenesis protein Ccs1 [Geobacter sp. OR-1]|uniref:cytochrome c biogenesis protein ResB n=1 Tax=Geobacter sp. OR-1 TaxID=1266765 RepID=UPI000543C9AD|nr:cytochrome c biogenesis protein ResB [Geobacter sp. OR-1]GAM08041.1 cytochrome c biogenesis protein Ccs1 [Geobacter sp. OR-1]